MFLFPSFYALSGGRTKPDVNHHIIAVEFCFTLAVLHLCNLFLIYLT